MSGSKKDEAAKPAETTRKAADKQATDVAKPADEAKVDATVTPEVQADAAQDFHGEIVEQVHERLVEDFGANSGATLEQLQAEADAGDGEPEGDELRVGPDTVDMLGKMGLGPQAGPSIDELLTRPEPEPGPEPVVADRHAPPPTLPENFAAAAAAAVRARNSDLGVSPADIRQANRNLAQERANEAAAAEQVDADPGK